MIKKNKVAKLEETPRGLLATMTMKNTVKKSNTQTIANQPFIKVQMRGLLS